MEARCVTCHAPNPSFPAYSEPPLGMVLHTPEAIASNAEKIHAQAVATHTMPLGNVTQMTVPERETLGRWIDAGAPRP